MELISYFFRFFLRIKWWLFFIPVIVTLIVIHKTKNLTRIYEVKTTIYTGVMSGLYINTDGSVQNPNMVNNTIDNLINVITAKSTLRQVSMRLFAQHMMHGDTSKDNNYIQAGHFRHLLNITPKEVKDLIDKDSEEQTLKRLFDYAEANTENFLYGLFNWAPPYYSYDALSKIIVKRLGSSDMIELKYETDDPGITFNTLLLLNEEFMKQYEDLQFGETGKIIRFFEEELSKISEKLKVSEDSLTSYNIEKKIVNYDEQTKNLASLSRDFQLQLEEIFLQSRSSEALIQELEKRIGENIQLIRNSSLFLTRLQEISELSSKIAQIEAFQKDSSTFRNELSQYKKQLKEREEDFKSFADEFNVQKNTKEGYSNIHLIEQWLSEILTIEESKAKLTVMDQWRDKLDEEYVYYSPIGSTVKRKEREINFIEANYLAILHSLNTARLRQKSMQMNSATLRVLNPPTYPLSSAPTKRKMKIMTAFAASFIFVLGYFLLIEILDHTLRDRIRTERITSEKVIGAYPGMNQIRHRRYAKRVNEIVSKFLGNRLIRYWGENNKLIINVLSIEKEEGKTFLVDQLSAYFSSIGLTTRIVSWHSDFSPSSSEYLLAKKLDDFISISNDAQVTLIEYPPLNESPIPKSLLTLANVSVLIIRATRSWKIADKILLSDLKEQTEKLPVYLVLNKTKREEVEYFTGLLPPYTYIRKLIYRLGQLGLTAVD